MVNLAELITFWRKKEAEPVAPAPERIIPLPKLPSPDLETTRSTSPDEANRAREALKLLKLERQILGSAVTTIYESHTKGVITQVERDRLLEKYKIDLKRLEKEIDENQRVVDLYDLESAREELIKNFRTKLMELDTQIGNLKAGASPKSTRSPQGKEQKPNQASQREGASGEEEKKEHSNAKYPAKERRPSDEEEEQQISDAERRIEQIREEILRAMDRLEQIEAEG